MWVFGKTSDRRALCLIACLAPFGVQAEALPRVVSVNLCTDQLVLLLADPHQIVSLSGIADDPRTSSLAEAARAYPKNSGAAEDIYLQDPDIVVGSVYSDPLLLSMLDNVGVEVATFPIVSTLAAIPDQVRRMGDVLDQAERAEALASDVEDHLAARDPLESGAPTAAFFFPNGYTSGTSSLSHDILTAGGFRNLSGDLGMEGGGRLPLETLVLTPPDVLVTAPPFPGASRSEDLPRHQVLDGYAEGDRVLFTSADWTCGTPLSLRALAYVDERRREMGW